MGHLKGTGPEGGMDAISSGCGEAPPPFLPHWGPILSLEKCLCEPLKIWASTSDQCGLETFYKACDLGQDT